MLVASQGIGEDDNFIVRGEFMWSEIRRDLCRIEVHVHCLDILFDRSYTNCHHDYDMEEDLHWSSISDFLNFLANT